MAPPRAGSARRPDPDAGARRSRTGGAARCARGAGAAFWSRVSVSAALVFVSPTARADLAADAQRVVRLWTQQGATVERRPPVFLEHGALRVITIDPSPPGGAAAGSGCTTLAFLAPRSVDFAVDLLDPTERLGDPEGAPPVGAGIGADEQDEHEDTRKPSAGGIVVLERCGTKRAELGRMLLEMMSARGVVELLVARSPASLGDVADILPERAPGPLAPRGNPGSPVEPGPIAQRVARAEQRARTEGAERVARVVMTASPVGTGTFELRLGEGCHRLDVMADIPTTLPRRATDVDLEAHDAETGRLLARDRSDAPDGRVELCLGEATNVEVGFEGAAGPVQVTLSAAMWPLPPTIPRTWGGRARGGLAMALRRRHAPAPTGEAAMQSLGVQGSTAVPIAVEPRRCYLAAMAIVRGEARSVRLGARLGDSGPRDESTGSDRPEGAAIAFCTTIERSVVLDVEARGTTPWWVLAVWPLGASG